MTFATALLLLKRAGAAGARGAVRVARRVGCAATLGHDPLFSETDRVDVSGWWAYPCAKCGALLWPSVWGGVDERTDERVA